MIMKTKQKENFWVSGSIAAKLMAEYTRPKTERCTRADVQNVLDLFRLESEEMARI